MSTESPHPDASDDPLQDFIDLFADASEQSTKEDISSLPVEERLQKHIIDGEKKGIVESLEEGREKYSPLDLINDHLLGGMKVVGELFGSGEMQLPFVLQSAEVMKMAVAHLEQYMEKIEGQTKGSIVLATVKGDVHDIGKNLVDIILTNNGYTVHNIGIKVPINEILDKYQETKADAIGLSGLLVKSVNVMEDNLKELAGQNITVPVLLGGAALARHYCESHLRDTYKAGGGNVFYGKDAFDGLRLMDEIVADNIDVLNGEIEERLQKRADAQAKIAASQAKKAAAAGDTAVAELPAKSDVATDIPVPAPPFFGRKVVTDELDLNEIFDYINPDALFKGQWAFKKGRLSNEDYEKLMQDEVYPVFERMKNKCRPILEPKLVYGYWPCQSEGDSLIIFDPEDHDKEIERFTWPRQSARRRLCVADFFKSVESGEKDVIGMSCVTMGQEVSKVAGELFKNDEYSEYLYMHGMGVESAEGLAELWHKNMRQELGFGADDGPTKKDLFTQKYRGSRYSFGYPAVPDMSDQDILFRLLKPEEIGCVLTENWQIDPEQSTSAIIVHHPEAKYFNV